MMDTSVSTTVVNKKLNTMVPKGSTYVGTDILLSPRTELRETINSQEHIPVPKLKPPTTGPEENDGTTSGMPRGFSKIEFVNNK